MLSTIQCNKTKSIDVIVNVKTNKHNENTKCKQCSQNIFLHIPSKFHSYCRRIESNRKTRAEFIQTSGTEVAKCNIIRYNNNKYETKRNEKEKCPTTTTTIKAANI